MRVGRTIALMAGAAVAIAYAAAPAGAGEEPAAPLTVEKVIIGTPPPGTQFVVEFDCENGSNTIDQVVFDEFGDPIGPDTTVFNAPNECTPVETETGGAASVSYECEGSFGDRQGPPTDTAWPEPAGGPAESPCDTSGPQADPITVVIITPGQEATVTVTNTFPPPPEPEPLVVEPSFTG